VDGSGKPVAQSFESAYEEFHTVLEELKAFFYWLPKRIDIGTPAVTPSSRLGFPANPEINMYLRSRV
jgi:hypothetical protein